MFKPGDRVRFKPYEEARNAIGFVSLMKHLCGTEATVVEEAGLIVRLCDFESDGITHFLYTRGMLEPVENDTCRFSAPEFLKMIT